MVVFIFLLQTQDRNGIQFIRLFNHDHLKTTLQGFILFKIFLILIQGSRTNGTQFATCQCRLQDIGGIHSTVTLSGPYQCMYFINKEDNLTFRFGYFINNRLQTFLKFTFIFGTGNQSSHIQRKNLFRFQILRNVATYNTMCQTFGDSGLTHPWLTDQDRVVLCTTAQNLQYTTDFIVTANHRVEFTATGTFVQVDSVFAQ